MTNCAVSIESFKAAADEGSGRIDYSYIDEFISADLRSSFEFSLILSEGICGLPYSSDSMETLKVNFRIFLSPLDYLTEIFD